jgi:capsular polysaccharide biosynthesis protein
MMQNSALSSLASITGRKITNQANSTNEAVQILKSFRFFSEILNEYQMKVPLLASTGWSLSENKLIIDQNIYNEKNKSWTVAAPSDQEAYEYWVEIFSVSQDIDTGFLAMEIKHFSPHLAKDWLDKIVNSINEKARFKAILEAENSIEYLKPQFQSTELSEVRLILSSLIQDQIQTIMLAKSKPEYLFKVIDPAYAPESKSEPKRSVICIIGAFLGLFFSIMIGFLREFILNLK